MKKDQRLEPKAKTTVLLDQDLWDRFLLAMHEKRKVRSQSLAIETAMEEWLSTVNNPHGISTEPRSQAFPIAGNIDPKYEQYHGMLNTILQSGVQKITQAIVSNLAAFEAFALVMKESSGGKVIKSGKGKKSSAAELAGAHQAAIRSRVQLEEAADSDRRRKSSPERKTGSC